MTLQCLGLLIIFGCLNACSTSPDSIPQSAKAGGIVASPTPRIDDKEAKEEDPSFQIISSEKVRCGKNEFELNEVNNIKRQADDVEVINSSSGAKLTARMPTSSEYGNFSLRWAKATKRGFELEISWGTRIYHHVKFDFACQHGRFILSAIKHDTFDSHFPEDIKRYRTRRPPVRPNLTFEKFVITDFMVD
jgi:hypothetical protein